MFKENSFSVIIPTRDRAKTLKHAINSVLNQNYANWEIIVVDDGSEDNTEEVVRSLGGLTHKEVVSSNPHIETQRIIYVKHDEPTERVGAFNTGHKYATKDWICWLASDDEYTSIYLDTFNKFINEFPYYKIFNCAKLVYHFKMTQADNLGVRKEKHFNRMSLHEAKEIPFGDNHFDSGLLGAGMFIFRRDLMKEVLPDGMPYGRNCYDFADVAGIPGYNSKERTLGNPWGEDFFMIYKLTRACASKKIDIPLYVHFIR